MDSSGKKFDGHVRSGRFWFEMPCWLTEDLNAVFGQWQFNEYMKAQLRGEIDILLEEASCGVLEQEAHGFVRTTPKDADRTRIQPLIGELRVPEPFDVGKRHCRCRVFHYEPDAYADWLVSLGALIKDVDDKDSKTQQNQVIRLCDKRRCEHESRRN